MCASRSGSTPGSGPVGEKSIHLDVEPGRTVEEALRALAREYLGLRERLSDEGSVREKLLVPRIRVTVPDTGETLEDGNTVGVTSQVAGGSGRYGQSSVSAR